MYKPSKGFSKTHEHDDDDHDYEAEDASTSRTWYYCVEACSRPTSQKAVSRNAKSLQAHTASSGMIGCVLTIRGRSIDK